MSMLGRDPVQSCRRSRLAKPWRFDNRNTLKGLRLRLTGRGGYPHYRFQVGGRRFLYCYVRKNACSAFKELILHCHGAQVPPDVRPIDVMDDVARADGAALRTGNDHVVMVYRDPVERIVSLYLNKMVQRVGAEDLLANYRQVTGTDPDGASFDDFVTGYLRPQFGDLDLHAVPQRWHMLPIVYTDVISIRHLDRAMNGLIGPDLARRYFGRPVNQTRAETHVEDPDAWDKPAGRLHDVWRKTGVLPRPGGFRTPPIESRLRSLYAADYELAPAGA